MPTCLLCGEEIDQDRQPWRILDVSQPPAEWRPEWEHDVGPLDPDDAATYELRLGELDGYPAHLACLQRVIAEGAREDIIFRQPPR